MSKVLQRKERMMAKETAREISDRVHRYIMDEFLPGESPEELTGTTPLITGGILDSIARLKLVTFLEEQYGIEIQAHEADADHMDTIEQIVKLVQSKL
jgi:acyl carrier protein